MGSCKKNSKLKGLRPKYFTLCQLRQAELMDDERNFKTFRKKKSQQLEKQIKPLS